MTALAGEGGTGVPPFGEQEDQNVRPNRPCFAAATGIRRLPLLAPLRHSRRGEISGRI
jgi:hypothetical protein